MIDCLPGKRVLIVEDNPMLANDLTDLMEQHGADIIGPALELTSGVEMVNRCRPDVALLDINLGEEEVWPLARRLRHDTVPFVFISAECTQDMLPEEFSEATCLEKPARNSEILETVSRLLTGATAGNA